MDVVLRHQKRMFPVVKLGDMNASKLILEPNQLMLSNLMGWKWSDCIQPFIVGGDSLSIHLAGLLCMRLVM